MGLKVSAKLERSAELATFFHALGSDAIQVAAARGLNEHTEEQRRQSVLRISAFTGVPAGYIRGVSSIERASPSASMQSAVKVQDKAHNIAKFGAPVWTRSMPGAEASGWNTRRSYKGAFLSKGKVMRRTTDARFPLKQVWGPVLPNELVRRDWKSATPNPEMSERYAELDLTNRVLRHVGVALGF